MPSRNENPRVSAGFSIYAARCEAEGRGYFNKIPRAGVVLSFDWSTAPDRGAYGTALSIRTPYVVLHRELPRVNGAESEKVFFSLLETTI